MLNSNKISCLPVWESPQMWILEAIYSILELPMVLFPAPDLFYLLVLLPILAVMSLFILMCRIRAYFSDFIS